jgi:hypothetical protein
MKKLIVCLSLAALAMISTAQAGEPTQKAPAAPAAPAKSTTVAKTEAGGCEAAACCAKKPAAKLDLSVKGATLLARR